MTDEITTRSWGSRLKDAVVGIFLGIALIIAAIVLIFWNESNSLHTAQSLEQAQSEVIPIALRPIDPANNLKVVFLTGVAWTTDRLTDPSGVTVIAISLTRKVEMYQWKETVDTKTESQLGGSEKEIKTYSYNKTWSESLIDSSSFKTPDGHQNPGAMPVQSKTHYANTVTLGHFMLPYSLISKITISKPVSFGDINTQTVTQVLKKPAQLIDNVLYLGQDPQNPQPGDLRISMSAIYPQEVSIVAQQIDNTFQPYMAPAGEPVLLLESGKKSPDQMFDNAKSENSSIAWILRLISLLMMIGGFALLFNPLVVLADVLPILGTLVGFGTGLIAILLGTALWVILTAIAWFTTRPMWSIGLVVILIFGIYFIISMRAKNKDAVNPPPPM
jgi:hypothetical protein